MSTLARWRRWWKAAGCKGSADKAFERFMPFYCQESRAYHTPAHIEFCLDQLIHMVGLDHFPADCNQLAVEMAIWLHDAVMHEKDAERKSSVLAYKICKEAKLSEAFAGDVVACILATQHGVPNVGINPSAQKMADLVHDIDLAILGQPPIHYREYTSQIRMEYADVPYDRYLVGRFRFMSHLLTEGPIYRTDYFRHRLEHRARQNIKEELVELLEDL